MIYLINSFEYAIHPQHFWGLWIITMWLDIMPNNLKIALLVLTHLSIYNEESLVKKHRNLHKLLRRPGWSKKQSLLKPPLCKFALNWILFTTEYRKCFHTYLGPPVTFLLDSAMKDFIGLYYLFKCFYS